MSHPSCLFLLEVVEGEGISITFLFCLSHCCEQPLLLCPLSIGDIATYDVAYVLVAEMYIYI